jgi:hypothetical protein
MAGKMRQEAANLAWALMSKAMQCSHDTLMTQKSPVHLLMNGA